MRWSTAGVIRVVSAASDPDERVAGKGYAILRTAGIEVEENVLRAEAADYLAGYSFDLPKNDRK